MIKWILIGTWSRFHLPAGDEQLLAQLLAGAEQLGDERPELQELRGWILKARFATEGRLGLGTGPRQFP